MMEQKIHITLRFHQGDMRDFACPRERFDFIIHAATDASAQLNAGNPLLMVDTIGNLCILCKGFD